MLERVFRAAAWVLLTAACGAGADSRRIVPSYDEFTGRLLRLSADQNGDGRIDQWTYLDGTRPIRGEADADGDGRIERWEYFDARSTLELVGTSSRNDGIEDTWAWAAPAPDGELHVARSRQRDRRLDRHEYFRGGTLARVEEDTNHDGAIDKWERYDRSVLREVGFDTTFKNGRPDRRLVYDARGRFVKVEQGPGA